MLETPHQHLYSAAEPREAVRKGPFRTLHSFKRVGTGRKCPKQNKVHKKIGSRPNNYATEL